MKLTPSHRSDIARRAARARWDGERRLRRIARARELSVLLKVDVGIAQGTLLALERSPSERLARGLMRGHWIEARK